MARAPRLLGLVAALLTATVGVAAAASQPATSRRVGGSFIAVTPCGNVGTATLSWRVRAGSVLGVTIAGLPSTCDGGQLTLTLTGSGSASLGAAGPVTVAAGTATGTLDMTPAASAVTGSRLVISGP